MESIDTPQTSVGCPFKPAPWWSAGIAYSAFFGDSRPLFVAFSRCTPSGSHEQKQGTYGLYIAFSHSGKKKTRHLELLLHTGKNDIKTWELARSVQINNEGRTLWRFPVVCPVLAINIPASCITGFLRIEHIISLFLPNSVRKIRRDRGLRRCARHLRWC